MQIVPATRERFADWKALRAALYSGIDDEFHRREMEHLLAAEHFGCFLALDADGRAVGLLELSLRNVVDGCIDGPVGYVEGIYLAPEARGRGEGRRLLAFAADWFRARGCREMATDAELENRDAQAFYRAAGFIRTWTVVQFRRSL
jgi:aminoglycoside 6'-N-acetyltransferase I